MKLIVECSQKLVRLGENLWGKEQKLDKAEPLDVPTMTTEFIKEIGGLPCPQGYIFKDENGNVINATKIVLEKKKREYPKTYEECSKIVNGCRCKGNVGWRSLLLTKLQELLVCRDAYWQIAGAEMGLGKPWEPDWKDGDTHKFNIHVIKDEIRCGVGLVKSDLLSFPTEEMRDAFYENFKSEIESCKELL